MNMRYLLLVALLSLFLSSCNGTSQAQEGSQLLPAQFVDQHRCYAGNHSAICGSLPVYENPITRSGRMISLNVAVIKASSSNPAPDPVFFLAGGPSEAATQSTGNIEFLFGIVRGQRDIVLVDQRGTGGSHEVPAPVSPDFSGLSGEELEVEFAAWARQALAELDMDPRYYTTSVAMDDLDAVRQALGYEEINLFGGSYGATAAQYYLRQHEEHVRTTVLLAGSLLDIPIYERETSNAQRTLDLIFDQCEADAACQAAFPDLRTEFAALLDRLEQQPVEVTLDNGSVVLTRDLFAAKVEWITRDTTRIESLPLLIHQAYEKNDWTIFAEADTHGLGHLMMTFTIRCAEKWASFRPAEVVREDTDSYLFGWTANAAEQLAIICKSMPEAETPEGSSPQPPSQKPLLLFNGEWDILDPPRNVAGAQELWQNSLSLTIPWQSHEISNRSVAMCLQQITGNFIEHAAVDELDAGCLSEFRPPVFKTRK